MPARRGLLLALLVLPAVPLAAQEGRPAYDASPLLPADHWAVRAAWRAEALGLAPGFMPAQRGAPRAAVAAALEQAASRAGSGSPYGALASDWLVRFREEFREYGEGVEPAGLTRLGGSAGAGYQGWSGRLAPAVGISAGRSDAAPLPDHSEGRLRAAAGVAIGRGGALHLDGAASAAHAGLLHWEAVVGAGPVSLSLGRAGVGYGPGRSGGIVLSTAEAMVRLEAQTTRAVRLPAMLEALGPVTAHTFAAPLGAGRHPQRPWLWGARVGVRPHDRFTLGVNRASIFGGDSLRVTPRRLGGMLVGLLTEEFENQIVALDARWRLPTDGAIPATAYVEWGAEDAAGAWRDQPARTFGAVLPALPWLPWASLGAEYTRFADCCGHGAWYTHSTFHGNWARGDALLGHPLGGEGSEGAVYVEAELPFAPVRLDATLFRRHRSAETPEIVGGGNLLAPGAAGRGTGGEVRALLRLGAAEVAASLYRDAGGDVRETRGDAEIRYRF